MYFTSCFKKLLKNIINTIDKNEPIGFPCRAAMGGTSWAKAPLVM